MRTACFQQGLAAGFQRLGNAVLIGAGFKRVRIGAAQAILQFLRRQQRDINPVK